jgi:sorting nexin-1/2
MDGFDDLLAPSRHVLEENPFEDPFAKRSNSPDPWSTPFAAQPSPSNDPDPYRSEFDEERTTTPTTEHYGTVDRGDLSTSTSQSSISTDPLDSAAQTADDDDDDDVPLGHSGSPRSPGFRESIPAFSEIATIRPTEPEELEPSVPVRAESYRPVTPTRRAETPTVASSPPTSSHHSKQISYSGSVPPSPSTSKTEWERSVVSPLEQPAQAGLDRSFAGLALGGEAIGGWNGGQDSWSNERSRTRFPTEDDSDDDKPILQSVKLPEHEDLTPVSVGVTWVYTWALIDFL